MLAAFLALGLDENRSVISSSGGVKASGTSTANGKEIDDNEGEEEEEKSSSSSS